MLLQGYVGGDRSLVDSLFQILYATDADAEFVPPGEATAAAEASESAPTGGAAVDGGASDRL